jgi:hypothetical protein
MIGITNIKMSTQRVVMSKSLQAVFQLRFSQSAGDDELPARLIGGARWWYGRY